jgi:hypothetical protein
MEKIKRMSRVLSCLFFISCLIYPLIKILYAYFYPTHLFDPAVQTLFNSVQWTHVSIALHIFIYAFFCMNAVITLAIFYQLALLFRLFSQGSLFEIETVQRIKFIGLFMVGKELIQLTSEPITTAVFRFYKTAGWNMISFRFGSNDIAALMTGLVILTISWIMSEANRLQDEEIHTV